MSQTKIIYNVCNVKMVNIFKVKNSLNKLLRYQDLWIGKGKTIYDRKTLEKYLEKWSVPVIKFKLKIKYHFPEKFIKIKIIWNPTGEI